MSFRLSLLRQYWISGTDESELATQDTTVHGKLSLKINNVEISGCDDHDTDYGINQASVQLLKSIFIGREINYEDPAIPHGCSIICTCPNCIIDFSVTHVAGQNVKLCDFYVSGGSSADALRYNDLVCVVPLLDYASQVVVFAEQSLHFLPQEKHAEEYEVEAYLKVRGHHEKLLRLAQDLLLTGQVTEEGRQSAAIASCFG